MNKQVPYPGQAKAMEHLFWHLKSTGLLEKHQINSKKDLAEKLDYSYNYLVAVFNGTRQTSPKLEKSFQELFGEDVSLDKKNNESSFSQTDYRMLQQEVEKLRAENKRLKAENKKLKETA